MSRDLERDHGLRLARIAAQEVLAESGITGLPIDVEALIIARDIHMESIITTGFSGAFVSRGAHACGILINAGITNPGLRRFTLAHELGHYCHPDHGLRILDAQGMHHSRAEFTSDLAIEREADAFAAELLMPEALCLAQMHTCEEGMACSRRLVETCSVSLTAASCRYADISEGTVAVIVSMDGKVQWCIRSAGLREHSWSRGLQRGASCPLGSPTRHLWSDPTAVSQCKTRDGEMRWHDWFTDGPSSSVYEQTQGLGSYGKVLTILSLAADETLD